MPNTRTNNPSIAALVGYVAALVILCLAVAAVLNTIPLAAQ